MLDDIFGLSRKFIELRFQEYERYFFRSNSLDHKFAIILGDRGIGKTTTLVQYLMKHAQNDIHSPKILYVQSDHILLGSLTLYEIAEEFDKLGGEFIAFDEIHKYSNWSQELKSITDSFPQLKIIASGSSALEIRKGSHDLSRRAIVYQMVGMSLREFIEMKYALTLPNYTLDQIISNHETHAHEVTKRLSSKNLKILPIFQEYLQWGYYPYFREYPSIDAFRITLEQNIHTTIEMDLTSVHPELTGNSVKKLIQLISYIAGEVPFIPSWAKIKSIIDVADNRTLKAYFKYLEDASLIRPISRGNDKLSGVEKIEKVFLGNTNQLYAFTWTIPQIGTIRETFILSMLQPHHLISIPKNGDFKINNKIIIEVGGKNKSFDQVKSQSNAFLTLDNLEIGIKNKIPLWLFGFLY